jgi:hypothetical protein
MSCRRLRIEDKAVLGDLVAKNSDLLGEGIRILARRLGTQRHGLLDLMGVDGEQRLVVIDLDLTDDARLFIESLKHFQWVHENCDNISKMLPRQQIDPSLSPRIVLIAPDFLTDIKASVAYFNSIRVDLFTYQYLEANGEKVFFLDPVDLPVMAGKPKEKPFTMPREVTLSDEEIAEFLHPHDRQLNHHKPPSIHSSAHQ